MFKIGDLAVYPSHGVGVIERIETRQDSGSAQDFYIMRILENDMIIMIPTKNVENVGLRELIRQKEVPKLYSILKKKKTMMDNQTWNRRFVNIRKKSRQGLFMKWLKFIEIS
jgi:CarD family transcriptional regulator